MLVLDEIAVRKYIELWQGTANKKQNLLDKLVRVFVYGPVHLAQTVLLHWQVMHWLL